MKRFRRHGQESQRDRLKQELFQFNKAMEHGFPHQPSALGYSPSLQLLAIGNRSGAIKLYGAPGVEFMGLHDENAAVTQVHFLPHQVELVTLLDDNSLHMWTLRAHKGLSELLEIGRFMLTGPPGAPPSVTRVTAVLAHSSGDLLLLGTEGGHVFVVEVPGFRELEERNISLDQVASSVPDDYIGRRNLEHVEALQENPVNPNQVVIGYGRGLMVIWDLEKQCAIQHIPATQQLESVWWTEDGSYILSSHSDGSYCRWMVGGEDVNEEEEKSDIPYGHFPCKAISKIVQLPTVEGPPFLLFSGGMPRASYGDRHCITVIHSKTHVALDFTSRIIDFFVIRDGDTGDPSALVVLVEEELVVIDLQTEGWPVIQTPYLVPLHSSAITCSHHISAIPLKLWERETARRDGTGGVHGEMAGQRWEDDELGEPVMSGDHPASVTDRRRSSSGPESLALLKSDSSGYMLKTILKVSSHELSSSLTNAAQQLKSSEVVLGMRQRIDQSVKPCLLWMLTMRRLAPHNATVTAFNFENSLPHTRTHAQWMDRVRLDWLR
ncbi:lethal(2) giant larvae protein homolog 2 [Lates japonicus]|uniref:LLGL scribble cell polarity complex component 2 n=1 Tax=Lates japonicus TaxID=270547 RepID=A0AAD3MZ96_LATJO|nr:lethal(2) giant larvae protein homolog 2 [Lates japonicus]